MILLVTKVLMLMNTIKLTVALILFLVGIHLVDSKPVDFPKIFWVISLISLEVADAKIQNNHAEVQMFRLPLNSTLMKLSPDVPKKLHIGLGQHVNHVMELVNAMVKNVQLVHLVKDLVLKPLNKVSCNYKFLVDAVVVMGPFLRIHAPPATVLQNKENEEQLLLLSLPA